MRCVQLLVLAALVGAACAALPPGPQDVTIKVKAGRNIKAGDLLGLVKGDPYCKVKLLGLSKETKAVDTTSEPQWNEELPKWHGVYPGNRVYVEVHDRDTSIFAGGDDLMGKGQMLVSEASEGGKPFEKWVTVKDDKGKSTGEVLLELTYGKAAPAEEAKPAPEEAKPAQPAKPTGAASTGKPVPVPAVPAEAKATGAAGPLTVRVVSGSGVVAHDLLGRGKSDPFVKVTVTGTARETEYKKDTKDPVWNTLLPAWPSVYPSNRVYVDLIDKDPAFDDFLGRGEVVVSGLPKGEWTQKTVSVKDDDGKVTGRVVLKLKYEPAEEKKEEEKKDSALSTGGSVKIGGGKAEAGGSVSIGGGKAGGSVSIGGGKAGGSVSIGGGKVGGSVSIGGGKVGGSISLGGGGGGGSVSIGGGVSGSVSIGGGVSLGGGKLSGGISVGGSLSGGLGISLGGGGKKDDPPKDDPPKGGPQGPQPTRAPGPYDDHPGDGLGETSAISCAYGGETCCSSCCPCGPYGTPGYARCCGCYYPYIYFCDMNAIEEWESANPDRLARVKR